MIQCYSEVGIDEKHEKEENNNLGLQPSQNVSQYQLFRI